MIEVGMFTEFCPPLLIFELRLEGTFWAAGKKLNMFCATFKLPLTTSLFLCAGIYKQLVQTQEPADLT